MFKTKSTLPVFFFIVTLVFANGALSQQSGYLPYTKSGDAQIIIGDTAVFMLEGYKAGTIQWQSSFDSNAWSDIAEATDDSLKTVPLQHTFYRAKIIDGTCDPCYSNVFSVIPLEYEEAITEISRAYLPQTFVDRLQQEMDYYVDDPDYDEYIIDLLDATMNLYDSIEVSFTMDEFKQAVDDFHNDFLDSDKGWFSCDLYNLGLGYAKGQSLHYELSHPFAIELHTLLDNQGGGGIEIIYDFVNMTSQIYTFSLCGQGVDELGTDISVEISASLGFTGYSRWLINTPYTGPSASQSLFNGPTRASTYSISADIYAKIGLGADLYIGKTAELNADCNVYNLIQCDDLLSESYKPDGIRGVTFGGVATGGAGAGLAIGLSETTLVKCYEGHSFDFKDYLEDAWFGSRRLAATRMAANITSVNPVQGLVGLLTGVDVFAAAAAIAYGFNSIEECTQWSHPHVITSTEVEAYEVDQGLYKASGSIIDDGGSNIINKGIAVKTADNLSHEFEMWFDSGDDGGFFEVLIGPLDPGTEYVLAAYAENEGIGNSYGNQVFFTTETPSDIIYGDGVTDIDGNFYPSVIIGNQEWMAENLRVTRDADGNDITRYCYRNDPDWCELYGGLYTWHTVMNGESSSSSNPSGVQGICPDGWHVPSHHEWTQLEQYICNALGNSNCSTQFPYDHSPGGGRGTNEGNALKSCRQVGSPLDGCNTSEHPRWNSDDTNHGFDEFGFSALPGGIRSTDGSFLLRGATGHWWSSTAGSSSTRAAWLRSMGHNRGIVFRPIHDTTYGFSLRCVRGETEDPDTYNLNLKATPDNAGSVSGAGEYQEGTEVTIEATANPGWEFTDWTGDIDYIDDPYSDAATLTMPADNVELTANFHQEDDSDIIYGDGVTDIDGNDYVTVIIGDQEWMAENLRVTRDANGNDITRYCYDNDETNCELYGGLYNWHTVMNEESSSSSNPSGVQGICPDGWHVPSHAQWTELVNYLDSQGFPNSNETGSAGNALKSCRQVDSPLGGGCDTSEHPRWNSHSTHYGFDEFGFSARPGGRRWWHGGFTYLGTHGYWWSSTEGSSTRAAWVRGMYRSYGHVGRGYNNKADGFSLRCVRVIVRTEDE